MSEIRLVEFEVASFEARIPAVVFLNIIKRPDDDGEPSTFEEEEARWSFSFARMVLQFFQQFLPKEG